MWWLGFIWWSGGGAHAYFIEIGGEDQSENGQRILEEVGR